MSTDTSPFLQVDESLWVASNELCFALRDIRPVTPGHTLVITKRLVEDWWATMPDERLAMFELVDQVRADLLDEAKRAQEFPAAAVPEGFNVGFNAGAIAGQTVFHVHVHVIPRYRTAQKQAQQQLADRMGDLQLP